MRSDERSHIEELAHLYVDGAFDRRELIKRVARVTGGLAAAAVALESIGIHAQTADVELCTCPDDVRVAEEAHDLEVTHQVGSIFFLGLGGRRTTRKRLSGCISRPHRRAVLPIC